MGTFKLPLSGDVVQAISPAASFFPSAQFGLVNVTIGQSSSPDVERDVLSDYGSYGKQLGQIADALLSVIEHLEDVGSPKLAEDHEIHKFKTMLARIAEIKQSHGRKTRQPRNVLRQTT